jgi:hypothetical protein
MKEEQMNCRDAYLFVQGKVLEYHEASKNPYVALVAADMDPMYYKDQEGVERLTSFDPAAYVDWQEAWNEIVGSGKDGTGQQVAKVAAVLLDYYANEVGYDLGDAREFLKDG